MIGIDDSMIQSISMHNLNQTQWLMAMAHVMVANALVTFTSYFPEKERVGEGRGCIISHRKGTDRIALPI